MTTETLAPEVPPVDPAVAAAAVVPPADPPAPVAAEGGDAPPPAPPAEVTPPAEDPKPHGNKGRKPWYLDRISEESEARRQAEERARNAEALLERSRTAPAADPSATTQPPAHDETAIETRARQIAQETLNGEKIRGVVQSAVAKFDDWDTRAATLHAAGAASPDFVLDVVSVDPQNAHVILHALADDPQKAARLAKMDTRTRTIELVKMSMAASGNTAPAPAEPPKPAPAPKTVSRAPAPPPPIEPAASQTIDWRSDKASDAEFSKGWEENARKRADRYRR